MATVLVTGTGFLGAHTIARLLADGHDVRTSVRSLARGADVQTMLRTAGAADADSVRFFAADLTQDEGWGEAAARSTSCTRPPRSRARGRRTRTT